MSSAVKVYLTHPINPSKGDMRFQAHMSDMSLKAHLVVDLIPFNQMGILQNLYTPNASQSLLKYKNLKNINLQFNGLCEIISNYMIYQDLLGRISSSDEAKIHAVNNTYQKRHFKLKTQGKRNPLETLELAPSNAFNITLDKLVSVEKTHILKASHWIEILLAYFFDIYPHSLFSPFESELDPKHSQLSNYQPYPCINKPNVSQKLAHLPIGSYTKFFVFKKGFLSMQGHSMVIKKTGLNDYSFFDPNHGEYCHLSVDKLLLKLNAAILEHNGNHVAFIDGKKYIQSLDLSPL